MRCPHILLTEPEGKDTRVKTQKGRERDPSRAGAPPYRQDRGLSWAGLSRASQGSLTPAGHRGREGEFVRVSTECSQRAL